MDAVLRVIGRRGARHHVERGLRHVGVRVACCFRVAIELAFHRRHVDDVFVALRCAQHQRLEPRVEHERRDRVDQLHLKQFDRRNFVQQQAPRVAFAQVDLLQVGVEQAFGEQVRLCKQFLGHQRHLRQLRCMGHACDRMRFHFARQQLRAAQAFVVTHDVADVRRQRGKRSRFAFHHVGVEPRRAAHRLAGVVDDVVEARARGQHLVAERLDARRMAQIQSEHLQAMAPLVEVGLLCIALRRIARETRGDDEFRAAAQQLQSGLVADLDPPAGEQRDASGQVGQFGALVVVERGAGRTHLVVEMMQLRVVLLAHIAVPRIDLAGVA